jgi:NAD(P)-dependent dehydrogenase (short-subunit alcohol dehydrogenase family)
MELSNKTVMITGATSGIGYATAELMLESGYHAILVGSNAEKTNMARQNLKIKFPNALIDFIHADLSNLSEVNKVADEVICLLKDKYNNHLDVLVNNAGAVRTEYTKTKEGYEYQLALNHLSGFLMSHRLYKYMQNGTIIFTGSYSHMKAKLHWPDLMCSKNYFIFTVYKQSKLCNIMTAKKLNEILLPMNIHVYVVDPGLVKTDIASKHTSWLVRFVWKIRSQKGINPNLPAKTYLYLAENNPKEGLNFRECKAIPYNSSVDDISEVNRLFKYSEELCKIHFIE